MVVSVWPPPVAVIVNSSLPKLAVALASIVSVEAGAEEETEVGEKEPVRPVPRPETLSAIVAVNPPVGCNVTVNSRDEPCTKSPLEGNTDRKDSGDVMTVAVAVAVRARPPPIPVIVNSSLPNPAVGAAIVNVETGSVEDTELGEKEPVNPVPRPETLSATEEGNPPAGVNVTVNSRDEPCATFPLKGNTDREKSGGTVTVAVAVSVSVWPPPVPVIVNAPLPNEALALAVIVSVEAVAVEDTELGEKELVNPVPKFETLSATGSVNPAAGCNVTV